MRRLLLLICVLLLLLCGCATVDSPETTTYVTETTTVPGLYVPQSDIEQTTGGAVRQYDLSDISGTSICAVGDKLLIVNEEADIRLTELIGTDCVAGATAVLPAGTIWKATYTGVMYYDLANRQVVILDPQLQQRDTVPMPEDMIGLPVFAPDGSEIYYCVQGQIRGIESERKISRIIRTHSYVEQELLGCYFEGEVLACRFVAEGGKRETIYFSSVDGQTIHMDNSVNTLYTYEETYLALRQEGTIQRYLLGDRTTEPQMILGKDHIFPALELGGVVGLLCADDKIVVNYYENASGLRTASLELSGYMQVLDVFADRWSGCLWLLACRTAEEAPTLLRWDYKASTVADEAVYFGKLYTAEDSDEDGLKNCEERAESLSRKYGVSVRVWERAVKTVGVHAVEMEYQVDAVSEAIDQIETALSVFPEKFIEKSASEKVRICIVRSIDGRFDPVQFWNNGNPFVLICSGEKVYEDFMRAFSRLIDRRVRGNTSVFDQWDSLNPEGFVYGDQSTYDTAWLAGDSAAFVNEASMASAKEDRAQIFSQAMIGENEEVFRSESMQLKLQLLCSAIRKSWGIEDNSETYLWEQYLVEPNAAS